MALGMSPCRCRFRHTVSKLHRSSKKLFWSQNELGPMPLVNIYNTFVSTCPLSDSIIDTKKNSFVVNQTPDVHDCINVSELSFFLLSRGIFLEFTVSFSRQRSSAHTVRRQTPRAIARIANLFETDCRHCRDVLSFPFKGSLKYWIKRIGNEKIQVDVYRMGEVWFTIQLFGNSQRATRKTWMQEMGFSVIDYLMVGLICGLSLQSFDTRVDAKTLPERVSGKIFLIS